jgi:hypothetical protein
MATNPELQFKTKTELLAWFGKEAPEWIAEYEPAKAAIKAKPFSGSVSLLKREHDDTISGFQAFLTELNLGYLLMMKEVSALAYEPKGVPGIDFSFDQVLLSIKSLQMKDYEKTEQEKIEKMIAAGGGKEDFSHKDPSFSSTFLEVEKNELGTFTRTRTEIGHSGFLESDIYQMSPPLKYIGEFENLVAAEGLKKVLFIFNYSEEFKPYHALDIGLWYFGAYPKDYMPIFHNEMSWYDKLFGAAAKKNNIDALIFMFPPNPLIWPRACFGEVINKNPRVSIFTKDTALGDELRLIFS